MVESSAKKKLKQYVKRYFEKHSGVRLIVVTGSVGKSSLKRALATILSRRYRIRMHEENHDDEISVMLSILGVGEPQKRNSRGQWKDVYKAVEARIGADSDCDIIIVDINSSQPGYIMTFSEFLRPDLAMVSSVTPEKMSSFGTIEAIATEELSISAFSNFTIINRDDIESRFAELMQGANFSTYGTSGSAEYRFEVADYSFDIGYTGKVYGPEFFTPFDARVNVVGEHSLRPIVGAISASAKMGFAPMEITAGLNIFVRLPGRMNLLTGIGDTRIIDDSYDANPADTEAAIQTLYLIRDDTISQRILVLGDMSDLGVRSQYEHERIGNLCDPNLLSWVVLVGSETANYTAPVARQRGNQVFIAKSAIDAGEFVRSISEAGSLILVKGSRDTSYLEETVKILCFVSEDNELVRQTTDWLQFKEKFFRQFDQSKPED